MNHLPGKQPQNLIPAQLPLSVTSSNIGQPLLSPPGPMQCTKLRGDLRFPLCFEKRNFIPLNPELSPGSLPPRQLSFLEQVSD